MRAALLTMLLLGAGAARAAAQDAGTPPVPAPDTKGLPAVLRDDPLQRRGATGLVGAPLSGLWGRIETLYIWRQTGQVIDYHGDHNADDMSLTKDMGADRAVVRPLVELGWRSPLGAFPWHLEASFLEWDIEGSRVSRRQNIYSTTVIPAGDATTSEYVWMRMGLEGGMGIWGYRDGDDWNWKVDLVAGMRLFAAWWSIQTESAGELHGRLGDPRIYVGVEAHKRVFDWLRVSLRGVLGNPSTIIGGYRFAFDGNWGRLTARFALSLGTPTYGEIESRVEWAILPHWRVGLAWREWFEQILDGGAHYGTVTEGFMRMNLAMVGVSMTIDL